MARKKFDIFNLAFLDVMACGLGAIILFYMIINAQVSARSDLANEELLAETSLLEEEVFDGTKDLIRVRTTLKEKSGRQVSAEDEAAALQQTLARLLEEIEQIDTASQITTDLLTQGEESVGKLADAWIAGISSLDADTTRRAEAIAAARELFGESLTPAQMRALDESGGPNPVENDSPGEDTIPPQ